MKTEKKPSRRTDAKEQIERIKELFAPLVQKKIQLSFAKFSFPITITDIQLAKLTDMKNAPDKRTDEAGKKYTPPVMQFVTDAGYLYFILEDIEVAAIAKGLRIITAANNIEFKE